MKPDFLYLFYLIMRRPHPYISHSKTHYEWCYNIIVPGRFCQIIFALIWVGLACGPFRSSSPQIIVWTTLRPVERELLQKQLDQFARRYPQYQFRQLYYQPEELRPNFIIAALAGKGPDLVHVPGDFIGPFVELEVVQPLDPFFGPAFLDSFITQPFPANTWFKGRLYQIADRVGNHLCLVYNKDLVAEPPQTISELIEMGKQIARDWDGDGIPDRYALAWNYIEPYFVVPFIGGYGGWILDEHNNPTLNTPAVIKAAKLIQDLRNKYQIIPKEADYETANALFRDGRTAMIINGPWSWGTYLRDGIRLGIARIPKIDETGLWPTPLVSPMGYMMNVNVEGQKRQIVIELIRFLTSTEVELELARQFLIVPSRKEALQRALNDPELGRNELYRASIDQMKVGRLMPVITEMRWIWDAMRPAYQGIFTGKYTPEEAAREMQRLAEKLIQESR